MQAPLVAHTVALFPQYFQTHIQFPDGSRKKSKKVSKYVPPLFGLPDAGELLRAFL